MSDSLRTDRSRASDAASEADRDAKIEQLLLAGLDHYFNAQYDQAINIWTRALFLDRNHARARAYIERARSAVAERQRESEELVQTGVAAFERGDTGEARRLLQAAIARGAPGDEAAAALDRLNRFEATTVGPPQSSSRREPRQRMPIQEAGRSGSRHPVLLVPIALMMLGAGAYMLAVSDRVGWRQYLGLPETPAIVKPTVIENAGLPLLHRGATALAGARALAAGGHLADALLTLDNVRVTDPQKVEADRLRSEIQRQLLGLPTGSASGRSFERGGGDRRVP
jgi:tetratricopeptide (TPR) repeat protein